MRIVSVSPFFNEFEILEARVELLSPVVNEHHVMEGDLTHQGEHKPVLLYRHEISENDAVKRHIVELTPGSGEKMNWTRERFQRDCLSMYLRHLDPADLVITTDIDEIPDPAAIPRIIDSTVYGPVSLEMRMLYYGLDWEFPGRWYHAKAGRWGDINGKVMLSDLRSSACPVVEKAGWHVSYWGGLERRRRKVEAFAHAENRGVEPWARIEAGRDIGPNGERLVKADPDGIPEVLLRRLGAPRD